MGPRLCASQSVTSAWVATVRLQYPHRTLRFTGHVARWWGRGVSRGPAPWSTQTHPQAGVQSPTSRASGWGRRWGRYGNLFDINTDLWNSVPRIFPQSVTFGIRSLPGASPQRQHFGDGRQRNLGKLPRVTIPDPASLNFRLL